MDDADRHFAITKDIHTRTFDGELVLLDLAGGDYYGVNEVGARLWAGFVAGKTAREVATEIRDEFDVSLEVLLDDLVDLTRDLLKRGLIRSVESAHP
ncbi:MAG: PqqD family protein [Polyangiaceae bacterium]